jgi:hypothetical protein
MFNFRKTSVKVIKCEGDDNMGIKEDCKIIWKGIKHCYNNYSVQALGIVFMIIVVLFAGKMLYKINVAEDYCEKLGYDKVDVTSFAALLIGDMFNCQGVNDYGTPTFSFLIDYEYAKKELKDSN